MDQLTLDKTATAILSSLLLLVSANTLVDMTYPTGRNVAKPKSHLGAPPKPQEGGAPQAAAPAPSSEPSAIALLAGADPVAGEKSARKCEVCHSFKEGGPAKIGPDLYDVVGRKVASVSGFGYSSALKAKGGEWTYEELDSWIKNPNAYVPGSKMAFAGVASARERAAILAYLRTLSANPKPLPANP
jgi:cytochrome c